jgi:DNA-binding MarR family transcriptional regulator
METDRLLQENPSYRAFWFMVRAYHSMLGRINRFFDERGITGSQFGVMRCVADAGPGGLMLTDLSKRLLVTCGNITGVVDRLVQAGYLRRVRPPGDRRVVLAQLTPEGLALYRELMPAYQELLSELLAGLSMEEKETIAEACERLHLHLEGHLPEPTINGARAGI